MLKDFVDENTNQQRDHRLFHNDMDTPQKRWSSALPFVVNSKLPAINPTAIRLVHEVFDDFFFIFIDPDNK